MISLELKKQKDPSKIGKTDLPNQKVEVTINHAFKDIRYGLWINPNSKVTRYRPVDFGENGVQVELPRALQMSTLIMRVFWNARDTFSKPDVYSKDIILVPNIGFAWNRLIFYLGRCLGRRLVHFTSTTKASWK